MGAGTDSFATAAENAIEAHRKCLLFMRARLPGTAPACAHIRMIFHIGPALRKARPLLGLAGRRALRNTGSHALPFATPGCPQCYVPRG